MEFVLFLVVAGCLGILFYATRSEKTQNSLKEHIKAAEVIVTSEIKNDVAKVEAVAEELQKEIAAVAEEVQSTVVAVQEKVTEVKETVAEVKETVKKVAKKPVADKPKADKPKTAKKVTTEVAKPKEKKTAAKGVKKAKKA